VGRHHFFVAPSDVHDGTVELRDDEAHHAAHVLRVRSGEAISVADGTGRVLDAVVTRVGAVVTAEVRAVREPPPPLPALTLYQAIAKGERMDDVISKAVEIGVTRIVPFVAERTVVRWDADKRTKGRERWAAIARAAGKQSRSPWLVTVEDVHEGVPHADGAMIVLHEAADELLRDALPSEAPAQLGIVVGPEGGLSPAEVERLRTEGANVVGLGERIFRTETAGLVAAAIVRYVYGSLG
jgi:16S rRNA (uracil1498-N3)-methyltransferase